MNEPKDDAEQPNQTTGYAALLRDPRWQRRRLEVLSRDAWTCQHCNRSDRTLHVHHRNSYRSIAPWEYGDNELQTLCEYCHKKLLGVRPGSVQLESGGYLYDGKCPWCGSARMKEKGSYDKCMDCSKTTHEFFA